MSTVPSIYVIITKSTNFTKDFLLFLFYMIANIFLRKLLTSVLIILPLELLIFDLFVNDLPSYLLLCIPPLIPLAALGASRVAALLLLRPTDITSSPEYLQLNEMVESIAYELNLEKPQIYLSNKVPSQISLTGKNQRNHVLILNSSLINNLNQSEKFSLLVRSMMAVKFGQSDLEIYLLSWTLLLYLFRNLIFLILAPIKFVLGLFREKGLSLLKTLQWSISVLIFEAPMAIMTRMVVTEKIVEKIDYLTVLYTKNPLELISVLDKTAIINSGLPRLIKSLFPILTPDSVDMPLVSYISNASERWLKRQEGLKNFHTQFSLHRS